MTDNIRKASDRSWRYRSPQVKIIGVKAQGILCLSDPSLNGYGNGSHSDGGDMGEEE